jgi:hypothetical protein
MEKRYRERGLERKLRERERLKKRGSERVSNKREREMKKRVREKAVDSKM